jgi:hypothetical protein
MDCGHNRLPRRVVEPVRERGKPVMGLDPEPDAVGGSGTDPRLATWLWRTLEPTRAASTMLTFRRSRTCRKRANM